MAKPGLPTPHNCPSRTQYYDSKRTWSKRLFSSSFLLFASFLLLLSSHSFLLRTTEAATARRGHSGTTIFDKIHFVGGLGTALLNDTKPLKSITTLNLLDGNTTDTPLTEGVYNHAASTVPFDYINNLSARIGLSFGQTTGGAPMAALSWAGPVYGVVEAANNLTTSVPYAGQPLAARAGHTMVQYETNNLWVIGGYTLPMLQTQTKQPVRDTPTFDYSSNKWSNQTKVGLFRFGHASAVASEDSILSCYGTILIPPKEKVDIQTSDCVSFSIMKTVFTKTNLIWTNKDDAIEGGLIGHSLLASPVKSGVLYMFGGTNERGDKYNQDLYKLDATNLPDIRITKMIPSYDAAFVPSARSNHVAVAAVAQEGFMIIQGGVTGVNTMADAEPRFYAMAIDRWLDLATFVERYTSQQLTVNPEISAWGLIAGILAGVSLLGVCVGMYIWRGIRKDTAKRLEREAADRRSVASPDFAVMEAAAAENRKSASGGVSSKKGRTPHPIYGMTEEEDHSLSNGPFKSTSSLIQAEAGGAKNTKSRDQGDTYQSNHSKPWVTEPASPGGTTLTENGSINGYYSSNSSQTPSRLNKKGSNASSQNSQATRNNNTSNNNNSRPGVGVTSESYYNPRDLYVDEDDDSSITVSLASESSTNMSPWTGPVRVSTDLAPPNPRFSRGAIPQAHRQLVDAIATGAATPMPAYAFTSNRNSNGWDTSSPGGSLSSRDDEYHRRSVNSMQWVSFEPMDLAGRPESQIYDPLSHQQQQRSNGGTGGLTVRNNASMYRTSLTSQPITIPSSSNNPRMSMFGGSNTSDTNTEDSGSYYGPGGKRISTALAARQQRRSIRNSQDSLNSPNGGGRHLSYQQQQQQQQQQQMANNNNSKAGEEEEVFVTKVLPIITNKVTKPTLAKVVTQQRGSRIVVPSAGPLSDQRSPSSRASEEGTGLGIDFSAFSTSQDTYMSGYGSSGGAVGGVNSNSPHRTSYQTRRTSNLNPNKSTNTNNNAHPRQQQRDSTNVILKMPPAPKHTDGGEEGSGSGNTLNPRSRDQQPAVPGVRNSIMDVGQDLSGYF